MGTLLAARPPQTLYVSIRRDELKQLKDEREQLQNKVAHLILLLQDAQSQLTSAPYAPQALN
jgi:hypothetical protein